jgi:pSer/pThr/pTyr-binding forkhead associated (FHA) protein
VVEAPSLRTAIPVSGTVTLGRKGDGEVVGTDDRYMSARHARFGNQGGRLEVTDLDSKNRTYVNDVPLEPHRTHLLSEGDVVRMGGTVLRVTGLSR